MSKKSCTFAAAKVCGVRKPTLKNDKKLKIYVYEIQCFEF